jgi:hypothetical protein
MTATTIIAFLTQWGPIAISAAAAAAAVLPKGTPGTTWGTILAGINLLALNFGNAKNAK